MKRYTNSEFAAKIRRQNPGSYDDLSDKKLVELYLKKYPEEKNKIIQTHSDSMENPTIEDVKEIANDVLATFFVWFGVIMIVLGGTGLFISSTSIIELQTTTIETYVGDDSDISILLFTGKLYVVKLLALLKELPAGVKIGGIIIGVIFTSIANLFND